MSAAQVVEFLGRVRASAILRTSVEEVAAGAMEAAVRAGFRAVEFTLTTPGALERIGEFSRRDDLLVGAGTVLDPEDARAAAEAGARFVVSPVVDEAVIDQARSLGLAAMPGCHTPTEMLRAVRAGAELQKLFPAPADGPSVVRACLGPLPFLRLVPTHGVDETNAAAHLAAGAHALGFVAPLFDPDEVAAGRFDLVEERARRLLAAVARARRAYSQ
ncbi:MAG: bifunctional 4-hydroxy-2-oxoglutarate aldolase/2-dehydro-3-deoxy-phosphogluconate aldolase [Planctomycetota bacterium]|nr:bifunctional 4-hydroxy-2-oxoglutarate aldolase/2-dehydro-3-deoxy-phosphogluconate aldolase [Planctomycetota bacterium]MDP6763380.1 bifunctional 4-hydroxy-2-oxoglutarate aldolase/2-dehydro-3-deoxy-phosphogluconate aldolase [Planctomycetota bacterium]MDP6988648.1 bifunctional 4-hydroxy-2-oxoglutarate aldolase/2-dehydro-3-deoxy-phosphogluconate aldolase [Planctomycetota bacterium]